MTSGSPVGDAGLAGPGEAMQWLGSVYSPDHPNDALAIVAWVNANGGSAGLNAHWQERGMGDTEQLRIWVRNRSGISYCSPGQWVVKGDTTFWSVSGSFPFYELTREIREFTVEDR